MHVILKNARHSELDSESVKKIGTDAESKCAVKTASSA